MMYSGSENTIAVPAINFKRYLGATGARYINMGKASKVQTNNEWDLEETIRQVEQKLAGDLKTIAGETTIDEKLLKTLVSIEKLLKLYQKITNNTKNANKVRHCLLRRQDNCSPGAEKNDRYFTAQETSSDQQNVRSSKAILVAETNKRDTKQMRRMYPLQNGWKDN